MVIIINNIVLYTWKLFRVYILHVLTTKYKGYLCEGLEVLNNHILVTSYVYQIFILYLLNWHKVTCQFHLNETGKKRLMIG